jgi:hypothetical protein
MAYQLSASKRSLTIGAPNDLPITRSPGCICGRKNPLRINTISRSPALPAAGNGITPYDKGPAAVFAGKNAPVNHS